MLKKTITILVITAGFLAGCMPSDNKSDAEKAYDKEQAAIIEGVWVLDRVNGEEVDEGEKTRIEFTSKGVAKTWLGTEERSGKWSFADSARVLAIQQGGVGERMKIRSLTQTELIYVISHENKEVELQYVREK